MPNRPLKHSPYGNQSKPQRESAYKRGYNRRWQEASTLYRREHPLCVECFKQGTERLAQVVDHIKPHKGDFDLFWEQDNWQPLCKQHHDQKTARERGFGREAMSEHRTVVCGLPASGKTTWVEQRRQPGDLVWDYDAIMRTMTGLPEHSLPQDLTKLFMAMGDTLTRWLGANATERDVYVIVRNEAKARRIAEIIGATVERCQCEEAERQERVRVRATRSIV